MPYNINWEPKGVYIKWSGKITRQENLDVNGIIYGDPRFDLLKYQISDILDSDARALTNTDVKVVASLEARAAIWNKNLLVAHITIDPKLIKQIKMYEEIMKESNWRFGIFDHEKDARQWIREELSKEA
ncbi:MAG: hypothetical protein U5Q03_18735 [Bacteroidota bacterium]|nr:hypothetical protein [Bacteroidota bacterium]